MATEALAQDAAMAGKFVQEEAKQDVAVAAKLAGRARRQPQTDTQALPMGNQYVFPPPPLTAIAIG